MEIIDKITSNFSKMVLYLAFIPLLLVIIIILQTGSITQSDGNLFYLARAVKVMCYINLGLYIASSILIFISERKSDQTTINVAYGIGLSSWIFCLIVVFYILGAYNEAVERIEWLVYGLLSPWITYDYEPTLNDALFLVIINMPKFPILLSIILGLNASLGIICIVFGSIFRWQSQRKI